MSKNPASSTNTSDRTSFASTLIFILTQVYHFSFQQYNHCLHSDPFLYYITHLDTTTRGVGGSGRSKSEHSHPPRLFSGRKRCASPAASDMSEALRPDPRPYPYLSLFRAFSVSVSLWRFVAVVCGGRVLALRWQACFRGLRGKGLSLAACRCLLLSAVIYLLDLGAPLHRVPRSVRPPVPLP
jgi:hypothetical protein